MEEPMENKGWMSVPEFGEWEKKEGVQDYSMNFSRIRKARKLSKTRLSVGNYEELHHDHHPTIHSDHHLTSIDQLQASPPSKWKRMLSYFTCCATT
ncbi:hypothetical protein IHE45_19G030300 [Dioscorea alata]|uniref:Uncharacterized protein n=1 Tax=Dioscorea alata TaxID=55571 RepID=A0ACB7TXG4_DIOAL|nr:hypothetical protein IHE45_19G030300 [Dioscorea alata]